MASLQDYINNIGKQAVDNITGFKGTITIIEQTLNGMVQYVVVPKVGKDGKYPDGTVLDVERVKVTGKGAKLGFTEPPVKLGDACESIVHGFKGVATSMSWHLNGCVLVCLSGPATAEGKTPFKWCFTQHVKVTEAQKVKFDQATAQPTRGSAYGSSFNDTERYRA